MVLAVQALGVSEQAMPRSAADEREYRRGLVLGFTLAEVLILLLFLLLLAFAARFDELEQTAEAFAKIKPLVTSSIDGESARDLVKHINSVEALTKRVKELEFANSNLN